MRNADEIFEMARRRMPMPDRMSNSEQMLYSIARCIYKSYKDGVITANEAKREKYAAISRYGIMALREKIYYNHMEKMVEISCILRKAEDIHGNGSHCEYCARLAKVFDGRIKSSEYRRKNDNENNG